MAFLIRVAVMEPDPIFLTGVAQVLATAHQTVVVGRGADAGDALELCQSTSPDVMLISVGSRGEGLDVVRAISKAHPHIRLIVLTREEHADHVDTVLGAGAHGYLSKCISGPELIASIRAVANGAKVVSPTLAEQAQVESGAAERIGTLTERERQVLASVGRGSTNKEVARELDLSEKTVKQYMSNIMDKLQVRNRVEAVIVARRIKPEA